MEGKEVNKDRKRTEEKKKFFTRSKYRKETKKNPERV